MPQFSTFADTQSVTSERAIRGAACEQIAAKYLEGQGLILVARNLRCKAGELDLVCRDGDVLAVVEVRQRQVSDQSRRDYGGALVSVNPGKQRKLIRAARFLLERPASRSNLTLRFDVVALQGTLEQHEIVWIKDAFRAHLT